MVEYPEDLVAQQRAALVTMYLMLGRAVTVAEIANELGLKPRGVRCLLENLSGVLPIYKDGPRWVWVNR